MAITIKFMPRRRVVKDPEEQIKALQKQVGALQEENLAHIARREEMGNLIGDLERQKRQLELEISMLRPSYPPSIPPGKD